MMDKMTKEAIMAKIDVLKELMDECDGHESDGLSDEMQKVTVMGKDKEAVEEGLEAAGDIMEKMPEDMMDEDEDEEESELKKKMMKMGSKDEGY